MNPAGMQERIEPNVSAHGAETSRYAGRAGDNSLGRALGYFILRLSLGVDMVMHYVVRTWGVSQDFVPVTERMFVGNLLPMSWVHFFLDVPSLLRGPARRAPGPRPLVALGHHGRGPPRHRPALRHSPGSDWTVVSHQMIYLLFVFILLAVEEYDYFSVDAFLTRRRKN